MILKAQRLAYTRKVIYKSVVESFGGERYLETIFCFGIFGGDVECKKRFQVSFYPEASATLL